MTLAAPVLEIIIIFQTEGKLPNAQPRPSSKCHIYLGLGYPVLKKILIFFFSEFIETCTT